MNTIGIHKIFLSALGRNPLPDNPEVTLYLGHETAPVNYPAIIAAAGLDVSEPHGNTTATVTARFTLALNPEDYTSDQTATLICDLDAILSSRMTTENLNVHAEEIGAKEFFYFFRWDASSEPEAGDGMLSFTFTYTGRVQF